MNWKSPTLKMLGLDDKEKEVLTSLKDPLSIQDLSRKSPIPRTTLAYIVKKLVGRGLVKRVSFGNRYKYYSIPPEQLHFSSEPANSSKKVLYYEGIKNIVRVQADFLASVSNERIYAIQPNRSWLELHSKVDSKHVVHVNDLIRNNNLILEGIIERDAYRQFKNANSSKKGFPKLAKSFGNRMADYVSAPEGFMTGQIEMWIIKNAVLFIDWREEKAIKIVDAHISHFLKDMFTVVKTSGSKIDHNQAMREVLN